MTVLLKFLFDIILHILHFFLNFCLENFEFTAFYNTSIQLESNKVLLNIMLRKITKVKKHE